MNETDIMVIRNIVSSESITVQSNYCLNFLPEKEHNETKSNIALMINTKSHLNLS